jgi:Lrp/AsnC family leucine-responsive transcriptional regulator
MDDLDRKLLDAVQRDATKTTDELAEFLGSSPSSVQRRLKRLRKQGIIIAQTVIVQPRSVGQGMTFVVGIEIEQKRPDLYANLQTWILANDAVQQAYNVTGASDFVLIITAASHEGYEDIMNRMMADNSNIKKYITSVVLQTFKRTLFVPINAPNSILRHP